MHQDAGCWAWGNCKTGGRGMGLYERAEVQIHRSWGVESAHGWCSQVQSRPTNDSSLSHAAVTSESYGILRRLLGAGAEKAHKQQECFGRDAASEGEV
jgi:hypothetical protein